LKAPGRETLLDLEVHFRSALLAVGLQLFRPLLQERIDHIDLGFIPKPSHRRVGRRSLKVETLFGVATVQRDYYLGKDGGHFPSDAAMGLEGSTTPALARLICRAGSNQSFASASYDLAEYGAITVNERQIQRVIQQISPDVQPWLEQLPSSPEAVPTFYVSCDGTGTPMRASELQGRKGKQEDGSAKTREVKVGALFTQHTTDEDGRAVRDYDSSTYVASYANAAEFSLQLRAEARRRGVGKAAQVVFLSDGALWTEDIAKNCFAGAASILDYFHAAERIHELSELLGGADSTARASQWKELLLQDQVAQVIAQAEQLAKEQTPLPPNVHEQIGFFRRHQARMLYGTYRRNGWFIGSGVVEAACKHLVGRRLKQGGMFWSVFGATCVLDFRSLLLSHRFDLFWTHRANAYAARNDTLSLVA